MTPAPDLNCFHCDEPVPAGCPYTVRYEQQDRAVCCAGCRAVAELIIGAGQGDYYRYRDAPAARVDEQLLERLGDWSAFDGTEEQEEGTGLASAEVLIEGMHCAACGWLIENRLRRLPGVRAVDVDVMGRSAGLRWDPERQSLGKLLAELVRLGYRPHPGGAAGRQDLQRSERRAALRRLGVAGLGMMQVMMYAVGTYFAPVGGMDPALHRFLELVSMLVATPVVLYAGGPFFRGALRALAAGQVNVDVPVALALGLAYGASCRNLLAGAGPVYFDSVSMFVFFLLIGRYVEMAVRHRALTGADGLARVLPEIALRVEADGDRPVPRSTLKPGDRLRVRHGDAFAADGRIVEGATEVDESLLTGEAQPVPRLVGSGVLAGSINRGDPVVVEATGTGEELTVSRLERILESARRQRPPASRAADRIAGWLVAALLLVAVVTWGLWLPHDPEKAFHALLAVLVVTCPCALSLATPSALAAATLRLGRCGLLVFSGDAATTLGRVTSVILDKTGTLTCGRPRLLGLEAAPGRNDVVDASLLPALAALERGSAHPLAHALRAWDQGLTVDEARAWPGRGMSGRVGGRRLFLGSAEWIAGMGKVRLEADDDALLGSVWVADEQGPLARLRLEDSLREDAGAMLEALAARGLRVEVLSGDQPDSVRRLMERLDRDLPARGALLPEDKLARVRERQARGEVVLAVGDGVNDGPVLAGADVSAAMASGAGLAQSGADMVVLGERLAPLLEALDTGRRTLRIIRQNLAWALGYNLLAVPVAAAGLIAPWMAAIGMSASSLVVVLNAARLARRDQRPGAEPARRVAA